MSKNTIRIISTVLILVIVVVVGFLYHERHHTEVKDSAVNAKNISEPVVKPKTTSASTAKSYYVGDTQTDGELNITLDSTSGATSMAEIPASETVFNVNITVTNNGSSPYTSTDAFVSKSSVYTQVGTDTSTGKYSQAYSTPCFGGGDVLIPPSKKVSGCVQFLVPKNALVDTYFFDNLKWYL